MGKKYLKLLGNKEVIKWCYEGITDVSLKNTESEKKLKAPKKIEKKWGNKVIQTSNGKQWTTVLCQDLAMEALIVLGRKKLEKQSPKRVLLETKNTIPIWNAMIMFMK